MLFIILNINIINFAADEYFHANTKKNAMPILKLYNG